MLKDLYPTGALELSHLQGTTGGLLGTCQGTPNSPSNMAVQKVGQGAYSSFVKNGLSAERATARKKDTNATVTSLEANLRTT